MNKKMFGVLIILFFLAAPAHAKQNQQAQKPMTVDDIVAKMKTQLQLTDQQVDEVKLIVADHLAQEEQLKLEEKKQLSKVLTGQQMFTWNFIQNDSVKEKKKRVSTLF